MKKVLITLVVIWLIGSGVMGYYYFDRYQEVTKLQEMRNQLQTANSKLMAENTQLNSKTGELESAKQSLTDANLALSGQLQQTEQQRNEYAGATRWWNKQYNTELTKNAALNKNIEALRKEVERLKKENETLLAENQKLQGQYNTLLASKQGLENQVASLDQGQKRLEGEKTALAQEIQKSKAELAQSEAERQQLQAQANEMNTKLQEALSKQGNLEEQIKTSQTAMEVLKQNEAKLKASNEALKKAQNENVSAAVLLLEQKKNFMLNQESIFRSTVILVATSREDKLDRKAKESANKLLVFMAYRTDAELFPEAEQAMGKIHLQESIESVRLLHKAWLNWQKARQEFMVLRDKILQKGEGVG